MSFHSGNKNGKHYWLTPPALLESLQLEFNFDYDACPYPKPDNFDGLTDEWGKSSYVNPPFGSILHEGKKKGPTAWARKAIAEHKKGKDVVLVFPTDKWIHYLIAAGAELRSLGDVRWCAIEDGSPGPGIGRFLMAFILKGERGMTQKLSGKVCDVCRRYVGSYDENSKEWLVHGDGDYCSQECLKFVTALQFYADPKSYEKGYVPQGAIGDRVIQGLLTDPLVIQDGGKRAREALGK